MAHFAEIDISGTVLRVVVVPDAQEARGEAFMRDDLGLGGRWVQTSYNTQGGAHKTGGTPIRKNHAGVDYKYDVARDAFIPPQPYASWLIDEATCQWQASVPRPADGRYRWDEAAGQWMAL